jgi:hypothetical protein
MYPWTSNRSSSFGRHRQVATVVLVGAILSSVLVARTPGTAAAASSNPIGPPIARLEQTLATTQVTLVNLGYELEFDLTAAVADAYGEAYCALYLATGHGFPCDPPVG